MTNCANEGAIAVLAFPDAALYAQAGVNSVYPDNWWLPLEGIVRDSARSTYGDPSSFFYPSFDGKLCTGVMYWFENRNKFKFSVALESGLTFWFFLI